jgi:hypothetical protein
MEIKPEDYFPTLYLEDVKRYLHYPEELPEHGPCGLICGMTAEGMVSKGEYKSFASFSHFLAVTYQFNKIDKVIEDIFPELRFDWYKCSPPYYSPDCSSFHGAVYDPDSMLFYFEREIRESEYLPSHELIAQYATSFIPDVVVAVLEGSNFFRLQEEMRQESSLTLDDFGEILTAYMLPKKANERGREMLEQMIQEWKQEYEKKQEEARQAEEYRRQVHFDYVQALMQSGLHIKR